MGGGHDGTNGKVVSQGANVRVLTHNTAVVCAIAEDVGFGEGGCTGAVADGADVLPRDAAVIAGTGLNCIDGNIGSDMAVADGTLVNAHDAADFFKAGDASVGKGDTTDDGAAANQAEETLVRVGGKIIAALIDADAADGVALAVEVAIKVVVGVDVAVSADGGVVVLLAARVVPVGVMRVGDVGGHLEREAATVVGGGLVAADAVSACAVDIDGEVVQVVGAADFVVAACRGVLDAADGILRPRRRGCEQHHEQREGCP